MSRIKTKEDGTKYIGEDYTDWELGLEWIDQEGSPVWRERFVNAMDFLAKIWRIWGLAPSSDQPTRLPVLLSGKRSR